MTGLLAISISTVPVFAFLATLVVLDSYRLVAFRAILVSIAAGCVAALTCLFINGQMMARLGLGTMTYSVYLAPLVEEAAKGIFLAGMIKLKRVGFTVDAAIQGFAIGGGFAAVENIYYFMSLGGSNPLVWVIRGFGTAAMHGTTMAVFGIISKAMADRYMTEKAWVFIPGFLVAVVTHAVFNRSISSPVATTLLLLIAMPILLLAVFDRGEKFTRDWLGLGFDTDQELLLMLTSGRITGTKIGRYLDSLQSRFPGQVVADMFCLLRVHTELSLRAKGTMMMQQAGIKVSRDPETEAKFAEMKYLEKSIGKTGKMAILPFLHTSSREIWQLRSLR